MTQKNKKHRSTISKSREVQMFTYASDERSKTFRSKVLDGKNGRPLSSHNVFFPSVVYFYVAVFILQVIDNKQRLL